MSAPALAAAAPTPAATATTATATTMFSDEELLSTQQFIENALDLKLKGNSTNYQYLIDQLTSPTSSSSSSSSKSPRRRIFLALPRCISAMAREPQAFQQLFDALFKFQFLDDAADVDAFSRFIVHLVSSNTVFVLPTLQMLARNLCRPQTLPAWLEPPPAPVASVTTTTTAKRIGVGLSFGGIVVASSKSAAQSSLAAALSPPPIDVEARIAARFTSVHALLRRILALVPTAANVLFPVLCEHVPHKRLTAPFQVAYVRNLLHLTTDVPGLQERVLGLVVDQLVAVDVEIKLDENDADVFTIDDFLDDELLPVTGAASASQLDDMANKLDDMMLVTFAHIASLVQSAPTTDSIEPVEGREPVVDIERAATVFRHLLKVFEHSILNTHRSKYPQFLLFFTCRIDPQFQDVLLSQLLATSLDPHVPPVTRHSCSAYLASFLARAKYISVAYIQKALYHLLKWMHDQMDIYDAVVGSASDASDGADTSDGADARAALVAEQAALESTSSSPAVGAFHESIYVSTLQTVCYVVCFRGLEVAQTPIGYDFLRSLGWERLLVTPTAFCPLTQCQQTVATEFLNFVETFELVSPACIEQLDQAISTSSSSTTKSKSKGKSMERSVAPSAMHVGGVGSSSSGGLLGQRHVLETFFPFDPYLLRRSFKYIRPLYLYWKHADPTSVENRDALEAVKQIIRDFDAANAPDDDDDDDDEEEDDDSGESSDNDSDIADDVSMTGSVTATPSSSFKGLSYFETVMQQHGDDSSSSLLVVDAKRPHKRPSRSTFDPSPALSASSPPSRLPPLDSANAFTLGGFDDVEDDGF